jgi:hypothetical protein
MTIWARIPKSLPANVMPLLDQWSSVCPRDVHVSKWFLPHVTDPLPTIPVIFPAGCIILNTASRQTHVCYPESQVSLTYTRFARSFSCSSPEVAVRVLYPTFQSPVPSQQRHLTSALSAECPTI